jgi:hypothetical protein
MEYKLPGWFLSVGYRTLICSLIGGLLQPFLPLPRRLRHTTGIRRMDKLRLFT